VKNFIYGAGGHGKVVWDAMQKSNLSCDGFIDDLAITQWMGLPVFNPTALKDKSISSFHIAIGNNKSREDIVGKINGATFLSVFHSGAIVSISALIKQGTFLAAGSLIGPDANIGEHSIVNHHAIIDHDCIVGDFCHIAPHATLGGNVKIGRGVLIGSGAIVLPGLEVGDYSVIGAGSVITKNVPSGAIFVGNPAKSI
jgi:sugar O-acyltransferase (sialic acid O-acetyltransferase NeuD family)